MFQKNVSGILLCGLHKQLHESQDWSHEDSSESEMDDDSTLACERECSNLVDATVAVPDSYDSEITEGSMKSNNLRQFNSGTTVKLKQKGSRDDVAKSLFAKRKMKILKKRKLSAPKRTYPEEHEVEDMTVTGRPGLDSVFLNTLSAKHPKGERKEVVRL